MSPVQGTASSLQTDIERLVNDIHANSGVPGIAVAVSVGGERISVTVGTSAAGSGIPLSADSGFQLGCITKLLTSLVALELADTGALSLDAPVGEYVPELVAVPALNAVRVRHLGSHTSGYQGINPGNPRFGYFYSWPKFLEFLGATQQMFTPGTTFSYEHTELVILGEILRRISGKPVMQIARERLFEPLGLRFGTIDAKQPSDPRTTVADHTFDAAAGHYQVVRAMPYCDFWMASLSNLTAGVSDLARLGEAFLGQHAGCGLSPEVARQARVPDVSVPMTRGGRTSEQLPVAFGFGCAEYSGNLFGHNGSARGQTCGLRFDPDRGLALVVGLNSWQPYLRDRLLNSISRLVPGSQPERPRAAEPIGVDLRELAGTYSGSVQGSQVIVSNCGNELACDLGNTAGERMLRIVMVQDEEGRLVMKSDAQHLSVGFFLEKTAATPCLMLGLNAFRKTVV